MNLIEKKYHKLFNKKDYVFPDVGQTTGNIGQEIDFRRIEDLQ